MINKRELRRKPMSHDNSAIARLRARLRTDRPAIAMAAHNPLAAKLAAEAGVDAIWGSGFELSASYAVPDANILSVDTHLDLMRAMGEVQDAPVIADIDTGYGNAVNVTYLVPRYAAAGVAAVVMEDKTFPKDSSLRPGGRQVLVPVEEFQGKVEAAQFSGGPMVVARTEAVIAGLGAEAGADAVLIHSKQKTPQEILEFCRAWPGQVPLVLIPTSYPQLSFAEVAALGKVGLIICGNHAIRSAVAAMRATFSRILAEGGIAGVEGSIAKVSEIFALQGDDRMRELEARFLR
jgi:phosphonopyruvate hydrolase